MGIKHENFIRLRDKRIENARQKIGYLKCLASPNYEYSEEEARDIVAELRAGVDEVAAAFAIKNSEPVPEVGTGPRVAIPGRDRQDIRGVLRRLQDGDFQNAIPELQHIVCGWVVPDKMEDI